MNRSVVIVKQKFKVLQRVTVLASSLFLLNDCARTTTSSQLPTNPQSTGEVSIQYSNYFTGGFITVGKFIYMFQQKTTTQNIPSGYTHTIFLKAIGGSIDSGQKAAYTWQATGLPSWLALQEDSSSFKLKATTIPINYGTFDITLKATSNESKTVTIATTLIVLNNDQSIVVGQRNFSNAYSASNTLLSTESVSDNDTGVSTNDLNGNCTVVTPGYQAILPGQEIIANAGKVGGDCYAIYIPTTNFQTSFTIRSLEPDSIIDSCRGKANPITDPACSAIIHLADFPSLTGSNALPTATETMGVFFKVWVNDSQIYTIPYIGNSTGNPFFQNVSATPLIWNYTMLFNETNAIMGIQPALTTETCNPNKSFSNFEVDTLCRDDASLAGSQAWFMKEGWYFFKVKSQRNGGDVAQKYSIRYDIDLN